MIEYWNHNTVYYKWVKKKVHGCKTILDVGCGDGTLIKYLWDEENNLIGIDPEEKCIERSKHNCQSPQISFVCSSFESFESVDKFDAIVFAASIHHMDMNSALKKAKSMLSGKGRIVIIGLSKPSSVTDFIIEALRVLPCRIISWIMSMRTSEEMQLPVSYNLPPMDEVRKNAEDILPGYRIHRGLFYRYLLIWQSGCEKKRDL